MAVGLALTTVALVPSGAAAAPVAGGSSAPSTSAAPLPGATTYDVSARQARQAREARQARQAPQRWLRIERTRNGYRVTAGLQDSRLRITKVDRGLKLVDPGTAELRERLRSCRPIKVRTGIGAVCSVAARYTARTPMKLGVVPRLGHDLVDASSLSARFDLSVLADAGHDVVRLGAGDDFVNGYKGVDRVYGGAGRDWIRTGLGDDVIKGQRGHDRLVGVEGDDVVRGGAGHDQVGGGPGRDRLHGGRGADSLSCGSGRDHAYLDGADTRRDCERLHR